VYTVLGNFVPGVAKGVVAAVMGVTLGVAVFLLVPGLEGERKRDDRCHLGKFIWDLGRKRRGWFLLGYGLVSFSILVYPVFLPTLLSQYPSLSEETGTYALLALLSVAALAAAVAGNHRVWQRVGPGNLFAAAVVFAGALVLGPVLHEKAWVAILLAGEYGAGLGAVVALHGLVLATFLSEREAGRWKDDMAARVGIVLAIGGVCAFAGIVGSAAVLESLEKGTSVVMKVVGGCLVGGGVLVGLVEGYRGRG
jgi:hypothetical protein